MRELETKYSTTASPGDGISPVKMSREPLATEGEATPGPDDYNPFEERETQELMREQPRNDGELFPTVPAEPVIESDVDPEFPPLF